MYRVSGGGATSNAWEGGWQHSDCLEHATWFILAPQYMLHD